MVTIIAYYKKRLRRTFLALNTSTSLQTTLAADAHLAEGQFLHEQTWNSAKSLIYRAGTIFINMIVVITSTARETTSLADCPLPV
jgi:Fe2+ transport system protein B